MHWHRLSIHTGLWPQEKCREAIDEIASAGFTHVEGPESLRAQLGGNTELVSFELSQRQLQLNALVGGGNFSHPEQAALVAQHEEIARFLATMGQGFLLAETGPRESYEGIKVDFKRMAERFDLLGKHTFDLGVPLMVLTRYGQRIQTEEEIDRLLNDLRNEDVQLCPDLGGLARADEDPIAILETYAERIGHVYWKDIVHPEMRPEDPREYVEVGYGAMDYQAIAQALQAIGYRGKITLELPETASSPNESLAMMHEYLRNHIITKEPA